MLSLPFVAAWPPGWWLPAAACRLWYLEKPGSAESILSAKATTSESKHLLYCQECRGATGHTDQFLAGAARLTPPFLSLAQRPMSESHAQAVARLSCLHSRDTGWRQKFARRAKSLLQISMTFSQPPFCFVYRPGQTRSSWRQSDAFGWRVHHHAGKA